MGQWHRSLLHGGCPFHHQSQRGANLSSFRAVGAGGTKWRMAGANPPQTADEAVEVTIVVGETVLLRVTTRQAALDREASYRPTQVSRAHQAQLPSVDAQAGPHGDDECSDSPRSALEVNATFEANSRSSVAVALFQLARDCHICCSSARQHVFVLS